MDKLSAYLRLLRPLHWCKNVFVFAALIFAEGDLLFKPEKILLTLHAFAAFCLLSSFAYVVNDIRDAERDRRHPRKCNRPIASGEVSVGIAYVLAIILFVAGIALGFTLDLLVGFVCAAYLMITLAYSYWLKHKIIVDVMCIAIGFVLRALAGVFALEVPLSPWLIVCTFTLCLFVGFGKRRSELAVASNDREIASGRRPVMAQYSLELLGHMLTTSAAIAIITFLLYTMDPATTAKFKTNFLIYTVPLVIYGVFRFAVLIQTGKFDGPMELLAKDRPFQATLILWVIMAGTIVRWGTDLRELLLKMSELY